LLTRKKNNIKKENSNVSKRKVVRTLKWVEKKFLCKKASKGLNKRKEKKIKLLLEERLQHKKLTPIPYT